MASDGGPAGRRTTGTTRSTAVGLQAGSVTADSSCAPGRPANEDRWVALAEDRAVLLAVADGMGGTRGGGAAATRGLAGVLHGLRDGLPLERTGQRLGAAVVAAGHRVRAGSGSVAEALRGGTTLTAAVAVGDRLHLAHVGDSSCWLYRRGRLRRLTEVHTAGAVLVRSGAVDASSLAARRLDGLLTRYLGMPGQVQPQLATVRLRGGDRVLVASDGLTNSVPVPALAALLGRPDTTAGRLVATALQAGARDDVTALLATVGSAVADVPTQYAVPAGGSVATLHPPPASTPEEPHVATARR